MNLILKRCPSCRSSNIYRRVRSDDWVKITKGKNGIDASRIKTKAYICRKCKYEFDTPFVGPRYSKKDESNMGKEKIEEMTEEKTEKKIEEMTEEKTEEKIEDRTEEKDDNKKWRMSDEEIKKLAEDLYKGLIFTDRHIQNINDVHAVFLPLVFLSGDTLEKLKDNPPGLIYEYMSKAGPRSMNGMPIFLSFRMLSQEDAKKMFEYYDKIKEVVSKV